MDSNPPPTIGGLLLRDVAPDDLPIFFEQQRDQDAAEMAAFPARNWDAFMAHWAKILADPTVITKTILFNGQVVGNVVSFEQFGKREIGYWLGKQFWGQGLATQALAAFLDHDRVRPLYAYVATRNHASRRVLEKCGFTVCDEDQPSVDLPAAEIKEIMLKLT